MQSNNICILGSLRTPFGKFWGTLKDVSAPKLGATVISGLLKKTEIDSHKVEAVLMGEALTAGVGQNPARQAAIFAGLPAERRSAVTINID